MSFKHEMLGSEMAASVETSEDQIRRALHDATGLASEVCALVGELCGYFPECAEAKDATETTGRIPRLAWEAQEARKRIDAAQHELKRLLSHFG